MKLAHTAGTAVSQHIEDGVTYTAVDGVVDVPDDLGERLLRRRADWRLHDESDDVSEAAASPLAPSDQTLALRDQLNPPQSEADSKAATARPPTKKEKNA